VSAEGTPRTLTVRLDQSPWGECATAVDPHGFTEQTKAQPLIEFIEKEPVLDLLERAVTRHRMGTEPCDVCEAHKEIEALLSAHGRLKGARDDV
jgi:hypothetical protein